MLDLFRKTVGDIGAALMNCWRCVEEVHKAVVQECWRTVGVL